MDEKSKELSRALVTSNHMNSGFDAFASVQGCLRSLLAQRSLPEEGLSDAIIHFFLDYLALLDSNNFMSHVGAGEREGRVLNEIVRRRHFGMSHGVGRSGDLTADQPKAAGSTLLYKLTNLITADVIRHCCLSPSLLRALVVPLSTGMALTLVLATLRLERKEAKYVIWSRIDQKTCLKCIPAAGLIPVVVELTRCVDNTGFLTTDLEALRKTMAAMDKESIACVLTTTSCFAPRCPDDVLSVARLCQELDVPHVVNNAYGLQSRYIMGRLEAAIANGRIDAVVQSTDKNFLVPVGGAVIASPSKEFLQKVSETYPGRASGSPITDLFITLLSVGRSGYTKLLREREELLGTFQSRVMSLAEELGEIPFIHAQRNDISCAMTLRGLPSDSARLGVGADLYRRGTSGPRVVVMNDAVKEVIPGYAFKNYGSHGEGGIGPYIAMACAIGVEKKEIEIFLAKLKETYLQRKKKE